MIKTTYIVTIKCNDCGVSIKKENLTHYQMIKYARKNGWTVAGGAKVSHCPSCYKLFHKQSARYKLPVLQRKTLPVVDQSKNGEVITIRPESMMVS